MADMENRPRALRQLGLNVRRLREAARLSQEAVAEKASLDRTYLSGIERGTRNPTILSVLRLATALGVTLNEIYADVVA